MAATANTAINDGRPPGHREAGGSMKRKRVLLPVSSRSSACVKSRASSACSRASSTIAAAACCASPASRSRAFRSASTARPVQWASSEARASRASAGWGSGEQLLELLSAAEHLLRPRAQLLQAHVDRGGGLVVARAACPATPASARRCGGRHADRRFLGRGADSERWPRPRARVSLPVGSASRDQPEHEILVGVEVDLGLAREDELLRPGERVRVDVGELVDTMPLAVAQEPLDPIVGRVAIVTVPHSVVAIAAIELPRPSPARARSSGDARDGSGVDLRETRAPPDGAAPVSERLPALRWPAGSSRSSSRRRRVSASAAAQTAVPGPASDRSQRRRRRTSAASGPSGFSSARSRRYRCRSGTRSPPFSAGRRSRSSCRARCRGRRSRRLRCCAGSRSRTCRPGSRG